MKKYVIFLIVLVSTILFSGCTSKDWTLMICKTKHYSGGCGDMEYELKGYKTQRECMEKGIAMKNPEGFECGYSCKDSDYGGKICNEICNETGCTK
jgi:hypothetical protein